MLCVHSPDSLSATQKSHSANICYLFLEHLRASTIHPESGSTGVEFSVGDTLQNNECGNGVCDIDAMFSQT